MSDSRCRICGSPTAAAGTVRGKFRKRDYALRRCGTCEFAFVADADTDYEAIYDERYYLGKGADPLINYAEDLRLGSASVKHYEARGIEAWAETARRRLPETQRASRRRWLDFGCGTGYLVQHLAPRWEAIGFETGAGAEFAARRGIPLIGSPEALAASHGSFDVISCIEVLEHVADPGAILGEIFQLLRPGGLFLFTTGNSTPFQGRLERWSYIVPEIHISFLSEKTARVALGKAGLMAEDVRWGEGFADIYRYKILRNLYVERRSLTERLLPWPLLAAAADRRLRLSRLPVGWKPEER